jgi:hypothetical protein
MAVAFNAKSTNQAHTASGTSVNLTTMTVGSGTNRALVATLSFDRRHNAIDPTSVALSWDSAGTPQSMTSVIAANGAGTGSTSARAEIWGLVAPTAGNKTLAISWTGNQEVYVGALDVTGASQAGGTTTFANSGSTTGSGTTMTRVQTSATNDLSVVVWCVAQNVSATTTQTEAYRNNTGTNVSGGSSYGAGAATVTHSFTQDISTAYVIVGVDIVVASSGRTALNTRATNLGMEVGMNWRGGPL